MPVPDLTTEVARFGGLDIHWDRRVLQPREWTEAQGRWAANVAHRCPDGPILELFCGAGQIGLLAAKLSRRPLVQVDLNPTAAAYARHNAAAAGVPSDVRVGDVAGVLAPEERFAVAVLDPPWVPTEGVAQFPDDPITAIDGGSDGTDLLMSGLGVALAHLHPDGRAVVQVGSPAQVAAVERVLTDLGDGAWKVTEVRDHLPGGLLLEIGRSR